MTLSLDKFVQRCLNLTMAMLIRVILTANAAWEPTINHKRRYCAIIDGISAWTADRGVRHLKHEGEGTLYTVFV